MWTEADAGFDVTYFTSEADARAGESKPFPPEFEDVAGEMRAIHGEHRVPRPDRPLALLTANRRGRGASALERESHAGGGRTRYRFERHVAAVAIDDDPP